MRREWMLLLMFSSSACASHQSGTPAGSGATSAGAPVVNQAPPLSSTSSVITAAEIQRTSASNLYDAILQLRPGFLASRGSTSLINEPSYATVVIVDGQVTGGVDELRKISSAITKSVRRLTAAEVYQLTGRSAPSGGIEVVLGR